MPIMPIAKIDNKLAGLIRKLMLNRLMMHVKNKILASYTVTVI